jgi:hypothetical protein
MAQAAAKTGAGPTVMVAIEQYFPSHQRIIIVDDMAYSVLPFCWGESICLGDAAPAGPRLDGSRHGACFSGPLERHHVPQALYR